MRQHTHIFYVVSLGWQLKKKNKKNRNLKKRKEKRRYKSMTIRLLTRPFFLLIIILEIFITKLPIKAHKNRDKEEKKNEINLLWL